MLTRLERDQMVLDLYNQGRTIRDIAKEVRMSFRDIGAVLKKEEEKERKRKLENDKTATDSENNQSSMSLSTQAYELFSQAKTPLDVAIKLDLSEKQVTKFYREYWKLKGLHKLTLAYEEIKGDIKYFLELYGLSKGAAMSTDHVVSLLKIANNDLPALENKYRKLQTTTNYLESKTLDANITLEELKSQIQDANQTLNFCRLTCQKEISKMLQLRRHNMGLDRLLRQFKNNNEEYIRIQHVAKHTVRRALSDSRQLLKLALLSIIELLRADPTKFNFLIKNMLPPLTISGSSTMNQTYSRSKYHIDHFSYSPSQNNNVEILMEIIVNGAANLYEKMVKDFTNETMTSMTEAYGIKLPFMKYSYGRTDSYIVRSAGN
jgi:hypothetical protein